MIQYSARARVAYARLFSAYNDIDVFVEDSSYVGLYEKLINRALAGKAKVTRVTPLGPRSVVETQAENDTGTHSRPRLYLVDGDLDVLAFARMKKIERLYRLKVYSVENLLFEVAAIEDYCSFASPSLHAGQCAAAVNANALAAELNNILLPYIVSLAVARRLRLRGSVFALNPPSVSKVVGSRLIGPCPTKVKQRVRAIITAIIHAKGHSQFRQAKEVVLRNLSRKRLDGVRAAPAKVFGLAYLNQRVEAAGGLTMNQKIIASYLAQHVRLENDMKFKAVIRRTAR
jgi:hypothetical protein